MPPKLKILLLLLLPLALPLMGAGDIEDAECDKIYVSKISVLMDEAGQHRNMPLAINSLTWHPDGKSLMIDMKGVNGYYSVMQLFPAIEGASRVRNMTSQRVLGDSRFHNGNPRWLPNGEGFLFSGQDYFLQESASSIPGYGFGCGIYYGDRQGRAFYRIADAVSSNKHLSGCVMPLVSSEGDILFWTECHWEPGSTSSWGIRRIKQAGLTWENGLPQLSNAVDITPKKLSRAFIETSDIRAGRLLYSASENEKLWYEMDIFVQNASITRKDNEPRNLTADKNALDRFPSFSPKAKKIAWSSTSGFDMSYIAVDSLRWQSELRSELWIMDADGRNRQRMTFFNQKGNDHYMAPKGAYVYMLSWHPKLDNIIALVLRRPVEDYVSSSVLLLELSIRK